MNKKKYHKTISFIHGLENLTGISRFFFLNIKKCISFLDITYSNSIEYKRISYVSILYYIMIL